MASMKAALVRKVPVLLDYTYYHFTRCKIVVLMVLIIEVCEVIRLLHKHLKSENPLIFHNFLCF